MITALAVLIEPLVLFKNNKSIPLSFDHYFKLSQYSLIIVAPFVTFLVWANWREWAKRKRGYKWIGKFEVIDKRSTFAFNYLLLSPGLGNELNVGRGLFEQTAVGDFILIHRDAFGKIEEIVKVKDLTNRLAMNRGGRVSKPKKKSHTKFDQH